MVTNGAKLLQTSTPHPHTWVAPPLQNSRPKTSGRTRSRRPSGPRHAPEGPSEAKPRKAPTSAPPSLNCSTSLFLLPTPEPGHWLEGGDRPASPPRLAGRRLRRPPLRLAAASRDRLPLELPLASRSARHFWAAPTPSARDVPENGGRAVARCLRGCVPALAAPVRRPLAAASLGGEWDRRARRRALRHDGLGGQRRFRVSISKQGNADADGRRRALHEAHLPARCATSLSLSLCLSASLPLCLSASLPLCLSASLPLSLCIWVSLSLGRSCRLSHPR